MIRMAKGFSKHPLQARIKAAFGFRCFLQYVFRRLVFLQFQLGVTIGFSQFLNVLPPPIDRLLILEMPIDAAPALRL